jgi:hypothetical protein
MLSEKRKANQQMRQHIKITVCSIISLSSRVDKKLQIKATGIKIMSFPYPLTFLLTTYLCRGCFFYTVQLRLASPGILHVEEI